MLLIDENAEAQLLAALTTYKASDDDAIYIYFIARPEWDISALQKAVLDATRLHHPSNEAQLYMMSSRTVCVLSPVITSADANKIINDVATTIGEPADLKWAIAQKLRYDHYGLLDIVQMQYTSQQSALKEATLRKQKALSQARRSAILGQGANAQTATIHTRRTARSDAKIMLIEDDDFSRQIVKSAIKKHHHITALPEATHALDTYVSLAPDVLLLDINLPDVSGHELLERIIEMDPHAYVIMLSGNADMPNIKQAMGKGAKGFIGKPFSKEKLFQYINQCPTIATQD
jgi:two-component system chemotaxis response regulator CheY